MPAMRSIWSAIKRCVPLGEPDTLCYNTNLGKCLIALKLNLYEILKGEAVGRK